MKKKIITLCLVIALLSVAVIGGTLAYFTDVDQATNEFTVGNVSIDLWEEVDHEDAVGNDKDGKEGTVVLGQGDDVYVNNKYSPVMPGDVLTKKVTIKNDGTEGAYVALSVVQSNYGTGKLALTDTWFNQRIDNYYETSLKNLEAYREIFPETPGYEYNEGKMQKLISSIFTGSGWGKLAYCKLKEGTPKAASYVDANGETVTIAAKSDVRYYPSAPILKNAQDGDKPYSGNEIQLIAIDYSVYGKHSTNSTNMMDSSVYAECAEGSRIWVYYLYMPAGAEKEFDFTVTVPAEIDEYSIKAFDNMILDVRAAAIQTSGFETAKDAFIALENVYSFGYKPVVETTIEENG